MKDTFIFYYEFLLLYITQQIGLNNCLYFLSTQKVSFFYHRCRFEVYSVKKDINIENQKLMQLPRKISSSQVKPRRLKLLQQRIGDITCYMISTLVDYISEGIVI